MASKYRKNQSRVLIDNKLNWKSYIEHVRAKLSRVSSMISKIRYFVNEQCLLNLYYSFIQSHINYNLLNWTSTHPSCIKVIELKVKSAVRLISFKNRYEHTVPLFLKHKILPLDGMIRYKQGNFLWKICNGYIQAPISNDFVKNSYNPLRFNVPNPTCTLDKHKIVYSCTKYWNTLPIEMRKSSTINSFNERHKKHLLSMLANRPPNSSSERGYLVHSTGKFIYIRRKMLFQNSNPNVSRLTGLQRVCDGFLRLNLERIFVYKHIRI